MFASVCFVMFVSGQARASSLRVRRILRRYPASRGGRSNQRCLVTDHPSVTAAQSQVILSTGCQDPAVLDTTLIAAATLWLSGRKKNGCCPDARSFNDLFAPPLSVAGFN